MSSQKQGGISQIPIKMLIEHAEESENRSKLFSAKGDLTATLINYIVSFCLYDISSQVLPESSAILPVSSSDFEYLKLDETRDITRYELNSKKVAIFNYISKLQHDLRKIVQFRGGGSTSTATIDRAGDRGSDAGSGTSTGSTSSKTKKTDGVDDDKISCDEFSPFGPKDLDCLSFDDVIGLETAKNEIREKFVYPVLYPGLFPQQNKSLLLYGLPGTGKTYLMKAACNELQNSELRLIFYGPTGAELKGKYVGETEKRISALFECASEQAEKCEEQFKESGGNQTQVLSVIFIDEIDAIAGDRGNDNSGMMTNSVNTLLQKMDGIKSFKNIIVVGATNFPWELDSAVKRRFNHEICIGLPTADDIYKLLIMKFKNYLQISAKKRLPRFVVEKDVDITELYGKIDEEEAEISELTEKEKHQRKIDKIRSNIENMALNDRKRLILEELLHESGDFLDLEDMIQSYVKNGDIGKLKDNIQNKTEELDPELAEIEREIEKERLEQKTKNDANELLLIKTDDKNICNKLLDICEPSVKSKINIFRIFNLDKDDLLKIALQLEDDKYSSSDVNRYAGKVLTISANKALSHGIFQKVQFDGYTAFWSTLGFSSISDEMYSKYYGHTFCLHDLSNKFITVSINEDSRIDLVNINLVPRVDEKLVFPFAQTFVERKYVQTILTEKHKNSSNGRTLYQLNSTPFFVCYKILVKFKLSTPTPETWLYGFSELTMNDLDDKLNISPDDVKIAASIQFYLLKLGRKVNSLIEDEFLNFKTNHFYNILQHTLHIFLTHKDNEGNEIILQPGKNPDTNEHEDIAFLRFNFIKFKLMERFVYNDFCQLEKDVFLIEKNDLEITIEYPVDMEEFYDEVTYKHDKRWVRDIIEEDFLQEPFGMKYRNSWANVYPNDEQILLPDDENYPNPPNYASLQDFGLFQFSQPYIDLHSDAFFPVDHIQNVDTNAQKVPPLFINDYINVWEGRISKADIVHCLKSTCINKAVLDEAFKEVNASIRHADEFYIEQYRKDPQKFNIKKIKEEFSKK